MFKTKGTTPKRNTLYPRLGLCCIFHHEPIKYRQTTARTLKLYPRDIQINKLSAICLHNLQSLKKSLNFVIQKGIGAFRIMSPLLPRYTHPEVGYDLKDLPAREKIYQLFKEIRTIRQAYDIRLSFHPDQFNVLSSPRAEVIANTFRELQYQGMLAELIGAEVINLHVGGAYGDKPKTLRRLQSTLQELPKSVLNRLAFENDDVSYSPAELLPFCENIGIPMTYDIHHHRCNPDGLTEKEVTKRVVNLWTDLEREPYFHISSPKNGWHIGSPKPHADYINIEDFPNLWKGLQVTVDVEAKAKELAVLKLQKELHL